MVRSTGRTALAGLVALALGMSALGPCHCLVSDVGCRHGVETPDTHACCETPPGVQALADECCAGGSELVLTSTEVPELAPPVLQAGHARPLGPGEGPAPVAAVRVPPPLSLDRTTVLLI